MASLEIHKKPVNLETEKQISSTLPSMALKSKFAPCVLSECFDFQVNPEKIENIILDILNNKLEIIGKGKNSLCYKTKITDKYGKLTSLVIKSRINNPKTNPDMNFENEALALTKISSLNLGNSQKLFFRFEKAGKFYLVTNFVQGFHPCPKKNPITPKHLEIILNQCVELDKNYLLHSDLKAKNILTCENHVGLIDFEFTNHIEKDSILKVLSRQNKQFCYDYNVSSNPYFPIRSNLSNFEFRTVCKYFSDIKDTFSQAKADEFLCCYLQKKSKYHKKWADFIEELKIKDISIMAEYAGITVCRAEEILNKAVKHERIAAKILSSPDNEIIDAELAKMQLRYAVFENNYNNRVPDIKELYLNTYKKFKIAVGNSQNVGLEDKTEFLINNLETMKMFYRIVRV